MNDLGAKMTSIESILEDNFEKIQRISPNFPKVLRVFAKYLIEIRNDRERGEELLERFFFKTKLIV